MRFPGIYRALNNETNNGHNNDRRDEIIEIGKTPKGREPIEPSFSRPTEFVSSREGSHPLPTPFHHLFLTFHLVFYATRSFPLCTCRVLCFLTKARKSHENKRKKKEGEKPREVPFHPLLGTYLPTYPFPPPKTDSSTRRSNIRIAKLSARKSIA